jgi:type VI secretion system secreted protein VgrG
MPVYKQADRPLAITTPLGEDVLLLLGFRGYEAISQLFSFELDLLAEPGTKIPFNGIVGHNVTVELRLPGREKRYLNGIVRRFRQGARDETFIHFRAELVPQLWLLTKRVRSRIFQHLPVPDILHHVLAGLDVTYEISGNYFPRDYCVQYRESDFDFASRLMEEEGIYYFFKHSDGAHKMVVSDACNRHPSVPGQSRVIYEEVLGGVREEMRIRTWEKSQELRSGVYTLWDHCFELPGKNLEAKESTLESVTVGKATHKLHLGGNDQLEIYDYPGGYAQRFDGIDPSGGPRPQDLKDILKDSERTARIRMEQEEIEGLRIEGTSDCSQFVAGHSFTLERHFDADDDYLLTRVEHEARLGEGSYRSDAAASEFHYENRFICIPVALSYRPQRLTRKPVIAGIQTATVVGPSGEEIFCDKYGRVKVQFHWDREGKKNADSSCWLRVAQVWAGKGWGAFFWPRIGHEVVVAFEEGDPDQPMIVGSVYNAENMPWFSLPAKKDIGGFKSASVRGKAHENFNGIAFIDEKGREHLALHSERDMELNSEWDKVFRAGRNKGERVAVSSVFSVGHLPGGGSGGGDGDGGGGDGGSAGPWGPLNAQGILGHNLQMVFGASLQGTAGMNHQLTFGSNLQLCYNPLGLLTGVSGPVAIGLAGGLGGNTQLTIGTNLQATFGQNIELNCGPKKLELNNSADPISILLCGVIGAVILVFVIAYHGLEDDRDRTILGVGLQPVIDALLTALLAIASTKEQAEEAAEGVRTALFEEEHATWTALKKLFSGFEFIDYLALALFAAIVPYTYYKIGSSMVADATGGGTGGGPDSHDKSESVDGLYSILGNQVRIAAQPPLPPAVPEPFVITIISAGMGMDGLVNVRGSQGVRVTSGPPPLPPTGSDSTNGVEIIVSEAQNVTIQRGLLPVDQKIEMTPEGITIDAGEMPLKIQSLSQITLSVAGGLSTITLAPAGVTIQGVQVQIN